MKVNFLASKTSQILICDLVLLFKKCCIQFLGLLEFILQYLSVLIFTCMISLTKFLDFAIVEALTTFKRAIFEDPMLVLLNWNPMVLDPCNWDGVYCSIAGDHVVKM